MMNKILLEDVSRFADDCPFKKQLYGKTFLVTGCTGLIGGLLARCLLALHSNIRIIAPVRDAKKAASLFDDPSMEFFECDLCKTDLSKIGKVDYVVHCASPTASSFFVEHPVETARFIVESAANLLDYCLNAKPSALLFLSSLEVYGTFDSELTVSEDMQGVIDPLEARSSYPIAKRAAENLCCDYFKEYGVRTVIARLTQTVGAGFSDSDNRVFAQFVRLAVNNENIVLRTTGESARPYCYTMDAIEALLYILLKGKSGEAYNVSNSSTYISAYDLATYISTFLDNGVKVIVNPCKNNCYAPVSHIRLSNNALSQLGWSPKYSLRDIVNRMIDYLKNEKE